MFSFDPGYAGIFLMWMRVVWGVVGEVREFCRVEDRRLQLWWILKVVLAKLLCSSR